MGRPCLFIRLTGCPLNCSYCDTTYAFSEGKLMVIADIIAEVQAKIGTPSMGPNAPFVEITGGEPMIHPNLNVLLNALTELGYGVAIETAGSHDIQVLPSGIIKIVDRKTPGSGQVKQWIETNLQFLVPGQDELKFVLCDSNDYFWAKEWCESKNILGSLDILFSPVWGQLDGVWLAEQIIKDLLPVRLQLQLHKVLWGPTKRGV